MDNRERVLSALTWKPPDVVPFVPKTNHVPRDPIKLSRLKSMGMGLSMPVTVIHTKSPNVNVETRVVGDYRTTIYHTPVGDVSEKQRINLPSEGGERGTTWVVERMFKNQEDYGAIEYLVEDQVYTPSYDHVSSMDAELGADGVLFTNTGYSPLMQLIAKYMGFERVAVELHRHRDRMERLMDLLDMKTEERVRIVAESPVKLVHVCGNIDGVLVNPKLFEAYIIPVYRRYNKILHQKGKITMTHMDGRLKCLKELIRETGLDAVQAFTPPPGGDLTLSEARKAWDRELSIWINIPEVTFYYQPTELQMYIRKLLTEASPGDGLVLGITETVPPSHRDAGLEIITGTVQKYGRFPIPPNHLHANNDEWQSKNGKRRVND